ncbi:FAD-binding oxidoreductase [Colwellia sp. PAMC 21821]|uniref:NAD(P)/FAD-dependent oxidoreductase n=1 Tax=Colwellia sp. PAMC 21821 TaxID=1816219 RepID=UPI0009BEB568|nr:FAD-binding oxidoreductase [Colwellia sp. PAMC 21821]ARD45297.1 FAD-dependent oxidoreductase [Colwellia sp. PAMC 21821]
MTKVHTPNHADSYYFSSLKYQQDYPSLQEIINADVCIVGGGFSGISSAIELAERGYKVVVLESHKIGWGASGRNGGQIIRGIGQNIEGFRKTIGQQGVDAITQLGFQANQIVIDRINKYKIDCDLTMGYCDLATRDKHMKSLEAEVKHLNRYQYLHPIELLGKTELKKQVIGSDAYIGGLIDMGSGHLHPLNLCRGEAQAASSMGVKIFEDSKVEKFTAGETIVIKTAKGEVKAKKLILAGNAYLGELAPKIAHKVLPAGSYIIATEPLDETVYKKLLPNNHAVCDQKIDVDYFRLSADKRLLFGGLCNYSGRDPKDIAATLIPRMLKAFPELADIKIDYQWGGMIGIGANRLPQIGRLDKNIYYAQAYAGHGVNITHVAGKILAEAIHGESDLINHFAKVKHFTFPGGKHLRSPLLAMGMMYHQLLDKF